MFFKKFKTCIALMMVTTLLFSITVFSAVKQGITYTAIGDSIAYGTGATDGIGYTDMFNAHLERKFGEGMYFNLSADGVDSNDLLTALVTPGDPINVQAAVSAADVITISIGGNDLLGPFLEALGNVISVYYWNADYTVDFESLLTDLAEWEMNPTTQPHFNVMLSELLRKLPDFLNEFTLNWAVIIEQIRLLNPNADIYVNTVFNPLKFSPILYQFVDPAIQELNLPIHNLAVEYDYKVVDVYSKFEAYGNPKKLAIGDLSTFASIMDSDYNGPVPLHPTDRGYKFIFNMHKDLMD